MSDPGYPRGGDMKNYYYRPQTKFAKVMFLHMFVILSTRDKADWGDGMPACTTGHMTKHYISSCTGDQSQLVTGQHTGNIKCMMGWVTWYPLGQAHPLPPGQAPPPPPKIWSMSRRYASYWNAFLFSQFFPQNCMKLKRIWTPGARS